jgi:putative nucleotidyltransferase with HDIG domain
MVDASMIKARRSQLQFYRDIMLYTKGDDEQFVLYKPAGKTLGDMRISDDRLPPELYMRKEDKLKGLQEAQKGFNKKLVSDVKSGDPTRVKETLVNIVEETLTEPRSGSLEGVTETVDIMVSDFSRESDVVKQLLHVSSTDYSTILHSINVMAFALGFAFHLKLPDSQAKILGLGALLHDVGKTKINQEILRAPRKLTDEEFEEMKRHPVIGYQILQECKFDNKNIILGALEHHEKLDGSGYPSRKQKISEVAQVLGIIDCYEALTNNDRPYRSAMTPLETLELLKKDVMSGKFDRNIFEKFVYSLARQ